MNPAVHIRQARAGDEAALALVGAATFLESFAGMLDGRDIVAHCRREHAVEVYGRWLADQSYKLWIAAARQGEAPIGYLALAPADLPLADQGSDDWEIKRVYVLSRFQGAGLGRALVERAKAAAIRRGGRRLLLGVYTGNQRAIDFYRRLGFQTVGARRFRVGDSDNDDLIMALALPAA